MKRGKPMMIHSRESSPCNGCTERSIACSGHCPKDARGEYGYKAWKQDITNINENRKTYYESRGMRYHG